MRAVRNFEEFIEEGIVRKQSADGSRARFLASESEKSYAFLMEISRIMALPRKMPAPSSSWLTI